jgi:hypothetical protein
MDEFVVINGQLDEKRKKIEEKKKFLHQKYYDLYLDYEYGFENEPNRQKSIYYGIKYVNTTNIDANNFTYHDLLKLLSEIKDINMQIAMSTFNEIINIFPIIKEFDGHKYECKDYYSTKEYLEEYDLNSIIGFDRIDEFYWNYYNHDIMNFSIKEMLVYDRIMKYNNQKGLLERFIDEVDPKHNKIHTYTLDKENNCMYDNVTGEFVEVFKPLSKESKYFKIIEGVGNGEES